MPIFQDPFWGYELTYPDDWRHTTEGVIQGFFPASLTSEPAALMVRSEWNSARQDITPFWTNQMTRVVSVIGARDVQSVPWHMSGAVGYEAEITLPKKEKKRLWRGILAYDRLILHFSVEHALKDRPIFEANATRIIKSLTFVTTIRGISLDAFGLPQPPGCQGVDPITIIPDIVEASQWAAYRCSANAGALQAFYLRELPPAGWQIMEYDPFPDNNSGFTRLVLSANGHPNIILGIMPGDTLDTPAAIAIHFPDT
jgi:hypothetical protein